MRAVQGLYGLEQDVAGGGVAEASVLPAPTPRTVVANLDVGELASEARTAATQPTVQHDRAPDAQDAFT